MSRTAAVLFVSLALAATACKKKSGTTDTGVDTGPKVTGGGGGSSQTRSGDKTGATARDDAGNSTFAAVYFPFDSTQLDDAGRAELQRLATWMGAHAGAVVTLEGHTDDRGTDEYNIALGDRRARTMRDYLGRLGVPGDNIKTISYGEERPAAAGDSDDAWAQNRRGEIVPRP